MLQLINKNAFKEFLKSTSIGGALLLLCVILSLILANTPFSVFINKILVSRIGFETSWFSLKYSNIEWINDGLMAIFFLLIGLEIKREIIEGELSTVKQALLPALAALGGVVVPALIYSIFTFGNPMLSKGWGIPMATDIAFAIGILSLLGNKVPYSLKIFLSALAIVDDLMAILVIAFFYTASLNGTYLLYAFALLSLLVIFNRIGVKSLLFYLIPGMFIWYFIHHSGIHATIAGVLTAMTIPTNKSNQQSPLEKLEHFLNNPVNFFILPLFAFANTNIRFESGVEEGLLSAMGLGIILGLVIGKPVGITAMCWIAVKMGFSKLPTMANWKHMVGVGLLGGIGFTMSIFVALLSFQSPELQAQAKFCILLASLIAGLTGYYYLIKIKSTNT